ncbi:DNA-binding transcriptional regulator, AcrR family [Saccharopolyspora antimicrobica]|uniref:DNA-binding transcriptional regulator, AcrR family n=1 Tax=Saccharopolyspora antimicrobica TaxID=455193 RepID=A0A1I5I3M2_9PSEU|nr:TetR/AcrR family transcriptional regulator [Saccharopolyspora antimicrobica]RKT83080.1 TetR family transcriptional regulator [Saccharopolyspora antimicrobica]SFO54681.1 DNA-binding transcriptional regulator, AcrR family [Saccharopolyspora antimicrobica]
MGTRDRMLDAAAHVMRTRGMARATTKEIAKESGFSEAALYKHFRDKTDLFLAVLQERAPGNLRALLTGLTDRAGKGELRAVLEEVATEALDFYTETFPMAASVFSEQTLFTAHRDALQERGMGPHAVRAALAAYLKAEQRAGALDPGADPESTAALLLGACFQSAFLTHFTDAPNPAPADLVRTLLQPLTPAE